MRIAIDFQGAQSGSRYRGIGRYATAFAKHLILEAKDHEVILVLNGSFQDTIELIRFEFASLLPQTSILVWEPISPVHFLDQNNDGRRLASEALREAFLASIAPDVVLITSIFEGAGDNVVSSIGSIVSDLPTAVILYDFIPLIYPKEYLIDARTHCWYMEKLSQMMKADLLLSISESSRKEGLQHLGFDEKSVVNISAAIELEFSMKLGTPAALLAKKFKLNRPYLMYSGASDPRKNLPRLVEAYSTLDSSLRGKHQLLLAGGMPKEHIDEIKILINKFKLLEDEVCFTGHITDDEMVGLYRGAFGFVFASYHEGFGLPILEAMAFNVPVIGSNISSIPEVIGDERALFDPFSVSSIRDAIRKLLTDASFRELLSVSAKKQRKLFSWQLTAQKTLRALIEKFDSKKTVKNSFSRLPQLMQQHVLSKHAASALTVQTIKSEELYQAAVLIDYVLPRPDNRHRLYIDVSELQRTNSKTGIQRVVSNIFLNLVKQTPSEFQVVPVFATRTEDYMVANRFMCEILGFDVSSENDHALDFRSGDIFLGLDYHDQIVFDRRACYDKFMQRGVRVYFVVYDLLPQLLNDTFIQGVRDNHAAWLNTVAKADGLICISKSVADELHTWLTEYGPPRKTNLQIGWFHLGADFAAPLQEKSPGLDRQSILSKIAAQQSFLIVSTIEPRKRQSQVLDGFELLWAQGENICLVLVGKRGWMVEDLIRKIENHPERNNRLLWLEGIDDQYLSDIYAAASCLIAASAGEGFGLSLIEAAHHNIPILARDIPVFKEVAGLNATYFSGMKGHDVAEAVQSWRKLNDKNETPKSTMMSRLTWQQSTTQILSLIFNSNWYREWSHDGSLRYLGSDLKLGSHVGMRSGNKLITSKRAGFLVFGPYVSVPRGTYLISVKGVANESQQLHALLEVAMEKGQKILGAAKFLAKPTGDELAAIGVTIPDGCTDLEVRIKVTDKANFEFNQVIIKEKIAI